MAITVVKTLQEILKVVIVLNVVVMLYIVVIVVNPVILQQLPIQKFHIELVQLIVKRQIQMKPLIRFQNKR
nr:MAG TPA: hypothetical protein [Caudoviricetes sp.]